MHRPDEEPAAITAEEPEPGPELGPEPEPAPEPAPQPPPDPQPQPEPEPQPPPEPQPEPLRAASTSTDIARIPIAAPPAKLAEYVVKALAEAGWGAVPPTAVQIKDTSGMGGSKTFRADAPAGTTPPAVALHVRSDEVRFFD